MNTTILTLRGTTTEDGRTYITSEQLRGFRLVVHPGEILEDEINSALRVFYPIYREAETRRNLKIYTRKTPSTERYSREMNISAELAFA